MTHGSHKSINTYLPFSLPVDPADVKTLVDLDLSYALGFTLVDWSPSREIVSALAEKWEFTGEKEVTFKINPKAKWSDGTSITGAEVVKSLERAKKAHAEELKSLFDQVDSIESKDSLSVTFKLKTSAAKSGIIRKLTEPMYGLVAVKQSGELDLTKSAGPYILKAITDAELQISVNKHWLFYNPKMAETVVVRRPTKGHSALEVILKDPWVNLVTTSSLMTTDQDKKLKDKKLLTWNRNLDRVFFLSPNPKLHTSEGRELLKFLNVHINRDELTAGYTGFHLTEQFFPPGYVLHDPSYKFSGTRESINLPLRYKKNPLVFLGAESRLEEKIINNLKTSIKSLTGIEPQFKIVPLNEFEKARAAGDYDLLAGALPVGDPNVEGAIGFIFGLRPPIIPNAGESEDKNFNLQIEKASKLEDSSGKSLVYKKIFTKATDEGCVLPLYQYSNVVLTKQGLDLSGIPSTDETISFAKVRFNE